MEVENYTVNGTGTIHLGGGKISSLTQCKKNSKWIRKLNEDYRSKLKGIKMNIY